MGSGGNIRYVEIQSVPRYFPSQLVKALSAMGLLLCLKNKRELKPQVERGFNFVLSSNVKTYFYFSPSHSA